MAGTLSTGYRIFGLGDKTGAFDRREEAFRMESADAYGWQESTDPIYKSSPALAAPERSIYLRVDKQ